MYIGVLQQTIAKLSTHQPEHPMRVSTTVAPKEAKELLERETNNNRVLSVDSYEFTFNSSDYVYQELNSTPNTTISLPYNSKDFLSFKVYEARQGAIVRQEGKDKKEDVALRCEIRGTTYTFSHDHLDLLSNSERRDLFNYLGIDGGQLY
jgi:hypothetical protein